MLCWASSLSHIQLFATLWTIAHQAPLSMGILQARIMERSQGGGGIGRGDHFLLYKFIERTTER